jgi:hypothetical protein
MGWYEIVKDFAAPFVGLCGIGVTGAFAWAGLKTFDRWKREKIEEKRIDVAIEALAIGYESKIVFDYIRARQKRLYGVPGEQIQEQSMSEVLNRVDERQPFFDKALQLEPKFVAVFGRDTATIFEHLFSARQHVIAIAELLIDEYRFDPKPENAEVRQQHVKWRTQIFGGQETVDAPDKIGELLQKFRDEIETICRPIVDRSFGTPRVGKT